MCTKNKISTKKKNNGICWCKRALRQREISMWIKGESRLLQRLNNKFPCQMCANKSKQTQSHFFPDAN